MLPDAFVTYVPDRTSMQLRAAGLQLIALSLVACGPSGAPERASEDAVAVAPNDSASLAARAMAVHRRYRTSDSLAVLKVMSFERDSLGVVITIYPECPSGVRCLGGGTRTRVWLGDSATLVGLER